MAGSRQFSAQRMPSSQRCPGCAKFEGGLTTTLAAWRVCVRCQPALFTTSTVSPPRRSLVCVKLFAWAKLRLGPPRCPPLASPSFDQITAAHSTRAQHHHLLNLSNLRPTSTVASSNTDPPPLDCLAPH
ncbi:hypothetical protein PMIN01_06027 [Paraphaeosphaeria minitans]|uniref:Uncharacterized protein n=1 Tax=Paraphaeosphaeria minitans TaxID=565426 RepID=A0A9P6GI23_9PLEO|nr:hypothetical protein PMIN01_06027 [Paraphaeosphaeria minitans]